LWLKQVYQGCSLDQEHKVKKRKWKANHKQNFNVKILLAK